MRGTCRDGVASHRLVILWALSSIVTGCATTAGPDAPAGGGADLANPQSPTSIVMQPLSAKDSEPKRSIYRVQRCWQRPVRHDGTDGVRDFYRRRFGIERKPR